MTTKTKVIIVIVSLATAFAVGRYTVPTKVVTETKVVEVEKKTVEEDKNQNKQKRTTITVQKKPSGEETTTTTIDESVNTDRQTKVVATDKTASDTKKEVVSQAGGTTISAMAGLDLRNASTIYGAHVNTQIIGPINAGAFGLSNGSCGLTLGLRF